MARENRSRYAVLGVLSYGPMSGYDIRKTIEETVGHFWSESYGQIYPILKGLVQDALATVKHEEQASKPDRKLYSITEQGEAALRVWLGEPVTHSNLRNELLLKVFFGGKVDREVTREHLTNFRDAAQAQLAQYDAIEAAALAEQADEPDQVYWLATLSYGKHANRALLDWANEILKKLEQP